MRPAIGIDFGTTNSVAALRDAQGAVRTLRLPGGEVFRSVLCFWAGADGRPHDAAGPAAIDAYLESPLDSRLIMSMKSYLAQRSFTETRILGRGFGLEALVATFLRHWLGALAPEMAGARITVGRPVRFVGERADDAFGEARLRAAFAQAGLHEVTLALEPAAAGHRFAQGLDRAATVLVADFGGGTSDFSLLRIRTRAARGAWSRSAMRGWASPAMPSTTASSTTSCRAARQGQHLPRDGRRSAAGAGGLVCRLRRAGTSCR